MTTQAPQASHAPPPQDRSILRELTDTYDIVGELAGRDDARTFLARRRDDGLEVVVVVSGPPAGDEGNALSHLAADAKLLMTLQHRSLLPVLDGRWVGLPEGERGERAHDAFAVILRRTGAPSLAELLTRRDEEFGYARIARILSEANGVLDWARERRVVHRVIRPETLYVEPGTDRVQVAFAVRPLDATGIPGPEADVATIASLARAMLTRSPAAPERANRPLAELRPGLPAALIEETERLLDRNAGSAGASSAADVTGYIARIAMADALRQAEEHLEASRSAIEIREREHREQLELERREHDAKIAAERRAHEAQLAAEREQHERAMEAARKEHERQVSEQAKRFEREREALERRLEKEREVLAGERAQHEREFAEQQRQFERRVAEQQRRFEQEVASRQKQLEKQIATREKELERQIAAREKELEREREAFRREMARQRESFAVPATTVTSKPDRGPSRFAAWVAAAWAMRPRWRPGKLPSWRRDWNMPAAIVPLALVIAATALAVGGGRARRTVSLASSPQRFVDSSAGYVYRSLVPLPNVGADTAALAARAADWTPPPRQRPVQRSVPQPRSGPPAAETQRPAPIFEIQPERPRGADTMRGSRIPRESIPAADTLKAPPSPALAPFAIPAPAKRDSASKADSARKDTLLRRPTPNNPI